MNIFTRSILAGGIVAALTGMIMRRSARNNVGTNRNIMNRTMNTMINTMGRLGVFRLIGRSRMFRNMVNTR